MVRLKDDAPHHDIPDAAALLAEAGRSGLLVLREGDRLRIRGPVLAAALARRLLADKPAVLAALDARDDPLPRRHRWNRPPNEWCPYGHPIGWVSLSGSHLICATCHPPASPSIVACRVGEPQRP